MYAGQIVEQGRTAEVLNDPHHSYTRQLLSAVPIADPTRRKRYLGGGLGIAKPQLLLKNGQMPVGWKLTALTDHHDVVAETLPSALVSKTKSVTMDPLVGVRANANLTESELSE